MAWLETQLETHQSTGWLSSQLAHLARASITFKTIFQLGKWDERLEEQEIDCDVAGALFDNSQQSLGKTLEILLKTKPPTEQLEMYLIFS